MFQLSRWNVAKLSENDEYAKLLANPKYRLAPLRWTLDVVPIIIVDGIIEDDVDWDEMVVKIDFNEWVKRISTRKMIIHCKKFMETRYGK
ncbi:hypothetical protein Glove_174g54 [Diversispora epigaea]|uniref:Uncharacterized protein n=1 Tax=Diversispora epigaea TaxID=1348612 RepID=A0A397INW5_9GLOM|nr:hypothetical protein Glove_174g54 [Diversispora epigaea]